MGLRDDIIPTEQLIITSLIVELNAFSVVQLITNDTSNLLTKPLLIDCINHFENFPQQVYRACVLQSQQMY